MLLLSLEKLTADALFDFVVEPGVGLWCNNTLGDQPLLPDAHRIAFFGLFQFFFAAVKSVIVRAGVTREPFHHHPEKHRSFTFADVCKRFARRGEDLLDIGTVNIPPVFRLYHIERSRIDLPGGAADAVSVVLNHKQHRQFPFFGETDRFVKVTLTGSGIAHCRHHRCLLAVKLDAPGYSACRQELRSGWSRHAPDVFLSTTVMRGHLPPMTFALRLCEIIACQLARTHTSAEHERAVAIIRHDVIVGLHPNGNRRHRFVTHS